MTEQLLDCIFLGIKSDPNLEPKDIAGSPKVEHPFSIPCFHDQEKQMVPKNASQITEAAFKWELKVGDKVLEYPDEVASEPTRIQVDPVTG